MAKTANLADPASRLEQAEVDQRHVRIRRRIPRSGYLDGYVVARGAEWTLLAVRDSGIYLDGWTAVRTDEVRKVELRENEDFVRRALELQGEWPPVAIPGLDLDGTSELVRSAADRFPLVTVHTEHDAPDECYIGSVLRITSRSVHLLDIDTDAKWETTPRKWPLRSITRVDVGGRYEAALAAVGGPPPREP